MPDPAKVLATVRRAATLMRATPGRSGSTIRLESADEVLVVGDLHGHVHVLAQVLKLAGLDRNPCRQIVLQEMVHHPRATEQPEGDRSHRLVDLICALKCQYPDRVHVLLGNHELSELTGRSISKAGILLNQLFRDGLEASYGESADAIYRAYLDFFASLPILIRTPNRVALCHTIPDDSALDSFDPAIFEATAWSTESMARGGEVYAITWGRDATDATADRFAGIVDADLFVIGHHPVDEGFMRLNDRVLVLDGTDPLPAYVLFSTRRPTTIDELVGRARNVPMPADG